MIYINVIKEKKEKKKEKKEKTLNVLMLVYVMLWLTLIR